MTKQPVSAHNTTSENLQSIGLKTWILKVYIHCEGCKKKVYKVLQSIDGVYKTVIDAKEHKATVTGSVNGETLVQKLLKSGKHAEILPVSFAVTPDNASGNSKKKKKQGNKQNDVVSSPDDAENTKDEKNTSKGLTTEGNVPDSAGDDGDGNDNGNGNGGGGKKKKNKKKKGDKNDNIVENVTGLNEGLNLGHSMPQMVYSTPYDVSPYPNYYPTPAYGVSYSTTYPTTESSYYTPPVYGYAQSHPSVFYPVSAAPLGYRRSAFDDCDDEVGEGRVCVIM